MNLPVEWPVEPMLAKNATKLPDGEGWFFEPKWDGFRCLVFRDGDELALQSRGKKDLTRYFPEMVEPLKAALPDRCVIDGEIVVEVGGVLSFDALGNRIHPAESRVLMLAEETPAQYIAFDVLCIGDEDLRATAFAERRDRLVALLGDAPHPLHVTPITDDHQVGRDWFTRFEGAGMDGVIGKPGADLYVEGKRTLLKLKHQRSVDVVVAGYRPHKSGDGVGSLLLGLYGEDGQLNHIGVASSFTAKRRVELVAELGPFELADATSHPWASWMQIDAHDGEQRLPGAPNRWASKRDHSWIPLDCTRVAEVTCNQITGGRLRHPAKMVRWRDDRDAESCTYDQLDVIPPAELAQVLGAPG